GSAFSGNVALSISGSSVQLDNFSSSGYTTAPTSLFFFQPPTISSVGSNLVIQGHMDLLKGSNFLLASGNISVRGPIELSSIVATAFPFIDAVGTISFNASAGKQVVGNILSVDGTGGVSVGPRATLTSDGITVGVTLNLNALEIVRAHDGDSGTSKMFN